MVRVSLNVGKLFIEIKRHENTALVLGHPTYRRAASSNGSRLMELVSYPWDRANINHFPPACLRMNATYQRCVGYKGLCMYEVSHCRSEAEWLCCHGPGPGKWDIRRIASHSLCNFVRQIQFDIRL
jgi:hypothetical protein